MREPRSGKIHSSQLADVEVIVNDAEAFWVGETSFPIPPIMGDESHQFSVARAIRQQMGGYHAGHETQTALS